MGREQEGFTVEGFVEIPCRSKQHRCPTCSPFPTILRTTLEGVLEHMPLFLQLRLFAFALETTFLRLGIFVVVSEIFFFKE